MVEATTKTYDRPPITEAIIELRFASQFSESKIQRLINKFKKKHPHVQTTSSFVVELPAAASASMNSVPVKTQQVGYRLASEDQADIVLVNPNSLTSARLAPYCGWDHFGEHALSVFKQASKDDHLPSLSRIGVRYINRLDFPQDEGEVTELQQYLNVYPVIPVDILTHTNQTILQLNANLSIPHWIAQITTARVESPLINHISVLLDIDVYREENPPVSLSGLKDCLETARDIKNQIFQNCITEKAEELFANV